MSPHIDGEPAELPDWFEKTQAALYKKWVTTTGHGGNSATARWACEIYSHCQTCSEHLSIPCSLAAEACELGQFLKTPPSSTWMFVRLYMILLSEFVSGLHGIASLLDIDAGQPPKPVRVWCNRFSKHRLNLHVQHHPYHICADAYGDGWKSFYSTLRHRRFIDRCGNSRPIAVIDYAWLSDLKTAGKIDLANDECQPVVAIPPLGEFLDETIRYFRKFVDACIRDSEKIKQFESQHVAQGCY